MNGVNTSNKNMERGVFKPPGAHKANDAVADNAQYQAEGDAADEFNQKLAYSVSGGESAGHCRGYGELEGYDARGVIDKRFTFEQRFAPRADVGVSSRRRTRR